jgi:hypothetical protein
MNEDGAERVHTSGAKPLSTPGKIVTSVTGITFLSGISEGKS